MKRALTTLAALLTFGLAACSTQPSWDEIAQSQSQDAPSSQQQPKTLDEDAVGKDVAQQYEDEFDTTITDFDCDDDLVVKDGATYSCQAKADGDTVDITITITSDDGDYTWKDDNQ